MGYVPPPRSPRILDHKTLLAMTIEQLMAHSLQWGREIAWLERKTLITWWSSLIDPSYSSRKAFLLRSARSYKGQVDDLITQRGHNKPKPKEDEGMSITLKEQAAIQNIINEECEQAQLHIYNRCRERIRNEVGDRFRVEDVERGPYAARVGPKPQGHYSVDMKVGQYSYVLPILCVEFDRKEEE